MGWLPCPGEPTGNLLEGWMCMRHGGASSSDKSQAKYYLIKFEGFLGTVLCSVVCLLNPSEPEPSFK